MSMNRRLTLLTGCLILVLTMAACGGLRYSRIAPDTQEFHCRTIGILPVDAGTYGESRGIADKTFADVLRKKGWFTSVITGETIQKRMTSDGEMTRTVVDYLTKLKTVNFSDPDLAERIGAHFDIDAFLIVKVDFWNYAVEGDDKIAKVGFSVNLVDVKTGKVVWEAGHHKVRDYWLIKPDLVDVAEDVAEAMINEMPH
jgi:hypothetical protein